MAGRFRYGCGMQTAAVAPSGFWGPPTSSIDWCETNYAVSHYVAEWFNTLSSVPLIVVGLLGVRWHWRVLERRFLLVFASVALVGVGSTAFHGTLLFRLQMLDELPMLYTATLMVYLLLEGNPKPAHGRWLPLALLAYLSVATFGATVTRGSVQAWFFQVSFTLLEFLGLYLTYRIYRASTAPDQRQAFRIGMALYSAAIVAWYIDFGHCEAWIAALAQVGLPNLQLHALWHVLVAGGLYLLILVIAHHRLHVLGREPYLERRGWVLQLRAAGEASQTR